MEPQIADYYNEMPHSVNVIDRLNEEFNNLQDDYNELKNELKNEIEKNNPPKVQYSSYEEWTETNTNAFKLIKEDINKWINNVYYDEPSIPFPIKIHPNLAHILYMRFKLITKEDRYSNKIAYDCQSRVESFIDGLKISNLLDHFLNNTSDNITDIFYDLMIQEDLFNEILII